MIRKRRRRRTDAFAEERGGEKGVGVGSEVMETGLDGGPGGGGSGGGLGGDELEALESVGGGGLVAVEAGGVAPGGEAFELLGHVAQHSRGGGR